MVSTMITLPWYAPLPLETEAQEHVWGGRGTHPPKNAYPLTIQHIQLKIYIFTSKSGKHEAYHGKHHDYLTMVCTLITMVSTLTMRNRGHVRLGGGAPLP